MTNWYHKFIKEAFRNPFSQDAILISKDLFEKTQALYLSGGLSNLRFFSYYPPINPAYKKDILVEQTPFLKINVSFEIADPLLFKQTNGEVSCIVCGLFIEEQKYDKDKFDREKKLYCYSNLTIGLPNNFSKDDVNDLYFRLLQAVRHEMNHLKEHLAGKTISTPSSVHYADVLVRAARARQKILGPEINSYIEGIMGEAKRSRRKFRDIAKETVDLVFRAEVYKNTIANKDNKAKTDKIINDIVDDLIRQAILKFPNLAQYDSKS